MLDLLIPEIGSTAGLTGDGVVLGRIAQSQLLAARVGVLAASTIFALRRDVNGADSFTDISSLAIGTVADAFLPWGTDAAFGASDELWLAAEKDICGVYVDLTTPGVWTGTGLSVLESMDGETLVNVGHLVDGSNGLRAAAMTATVTEHQIPNATPYLYYRVFCPTGSGTNPGMSAYWLYENQYAFPTVAV